MKPSSEGPGNGRLAVEEEAFLELFRAIARGWRALAGRLAGDGPPR